MASYQVALQETEPVTALRYRARVRIDRLGDDIGDRLDALFTVVKQLGLAPTGPPSISYPERPAEHTEVLVELSVPVERPANLAPSVLAGTGMQLVTRPRELVAHTEHHGRYAGIAAAHAALDAWAARTGHHEVGPHRETYLVGPGQASDASGMVTDVAVPVD